MKGSGSGISTSVLTFFGDIVFEGSELAGDRLMRNS